MITTSTIKQEGSYSSKKLQEGHSGAPQLEDAMLQKTLEESLFSAFIGQVGKK